MIGNRVKTGNLIQRLHVANGTIAAKFSKLADGVAKTPLSEKGSEISKLAVKILKDLGALLIRISGLVLTGAAYVLEGAVAVIASPLILGVLAHRNRDKIEKVALKIHSCITANADRAKQSIVNLSTDAIKAAKNAKIATTHYAKKALKHLKAADKSLKDKVSKGLKNISDRGGLGKVVKKLITTGYLPQVDKTMIREKKLHKQRIASLAKVAATTEILSQYKGLVLKAGTDQ